ncbi:TPA: 50S ribosomal protein L11 methyltransferase [Candidatus Poribacteria bacterium]|nr:50S ribosomal protein L11 methyltransferase [Candidatus Poribacteria bacterium]
MKMKWTEISITTSYEAAEIVSNFLLELGASGVLINDEVCETALHDTSSPVNSVRCLHRVNLITHFPTDDLIGNRIAKIKTFLQELQEIGLEIRPAQIEIKSITDERWSESWKSAFPPLRIGQRFIVSPRWNKITPSSEQVVIWLDPGMAFGTGYHPTTQLALSLLEEVISGGERVADIGTGSGILAIAAAKLGADKVIATDIDKTVIPIAQENARINGVEEKIEIVVGNAFESLSGRYDIIVVNILTKVILPIIPDCPNYLKADGLLIFSGILTEEMPNIESAARFNGLQIVKTVTKEDWVGVSLSLD